MKKLFATMICLFMIFTSWALQQTIDGINYSLRESTQEAIVIKRVNKYSGAIVIPSTVLYNGITYKVTSIDTDAFEECSNLTSVVLPSSLTRINEFAFSSCTGLTTVNIPNSVINIGSRAFEYCIELTSISIPKSVTSLGDGAFAGCCSLTSISVDEDNTNYVSEDNFIYSKDRTQLVYCITSKKGDVVIPNTVVSIRDFAFDGCVGLSSITIPISVADIGVGTFWDCKGLTSIIIPNGITTIKFCTFARCSNLCSVTIPSSVTSIEDQAFIECDALNMVTCLAKQVPSAAKNTFSWTSTVNASLYVPAVALDSYLTTSPWSGFTTVEALPCEHELSSADNGDGTHTTTCANCDFSETVGHTFVNGICSVCNIEENSDPIVEIEVDGIIYELVKKTKVVRVKGVVDCKSITAATISALITIGGVSYPVTSIGERAFYECVNLKTVDLPLSITSIQKDAFQFCSNLEAVSIPNSVSTIGENAFYFCRRLSVISIPSSVTSLQGNSFTGCENLKSITVESDNPNYYSEDNIIYSKDKSTLVYCASSKVGKVSIPNTVTLIGKDAFHLCTKLTMVDIPTSVEIIDDYAFWCCYGLTDALIPNSVTEIGVQAFSACTSLSSVDIPNSVTNMEMGAFADCSNITSVSISSSLTSIAESAFGNCSSLTSVTIPSGVTFIDYAAFMGCSKLTSVSFPNSLKVISSLAFKGCTSLTSVNISSVTWLYDEVFNGCTSLSSVTLGSSISHIYSKTFANCSNLETVICLAEEVPETGLDVFENSFVGYATLKVPTSSVQAYKTTAPWSEFGTFETADGSEIPELMICATPVVTYENGELHFSCETEGATYHCNLQIPGQISIESTGVAKLPDSYTIMVTAYATAEGYEPSEKTTTTFTISVCDVNGDGEINIGDVTTLVNKILQKDLSK